MKKQSLLETGLVVFVTPVEDKLTVQYGSIISCVNCSLSNDLACVHFFAPSPSRCKRELDLFKDFLFLSNFLGDVPLLA